MNDETAKFVYIDLLRPREPYVQVGQAASYVGRPGSFSFIGARIVVQVLDWNGRWYPVVLRREAGDDCDLYPDTELSVLHREVPAGFWSMRISQGFKNVHEYVRHHRRRKRRQYLCRMHRVLRYERLPG